MTYPLYGQRKNSFLDFQRKGGLPVMESCCCMLPSPLQAFKAWPAPGEGALWVPEMSDWRIIMFILCLYYLINRIKKKGERWEYLMEKIRLTVFLRTDWKQRISPQSEWSWLTYISLQLCICGACVSSRCSSITEGKMPIWPYHRWTDQSLRNDEQIDEKFQIRNYMLTDLASSFV